MSKWLKKEYATQLKNINNILKENEGKFKDENERKEIYSYSDYNLNLKYRDKLCFDSIFNRIILLETDDWKLFFIIDRQGIVRGYKEENDILELKLENQRTKPYYNINFSFNVEELSLYIGTELKTLNIILQTINNNISDSFNKNYVCFRLKKDNKELNMNLENTALGTELIISDLDNNINIRTIDEVFSEELYNDILNLFN